MSAKSKAWLEAVWLAESHIGNVRTENQDSFFADGALFLVADGMGGHKGGGEASRLAVEIFTKQMEAGAHQKSGTAGILTAETEGTNGTKNAKDIHEAARKEMFSAFNAANEVVYNAGMENPDELGGMGTTLCALYLNFPASSVLAVGNVGDSRIYEFRKSAVDEAGTLSQISEDHNDAYNPNMLTRAVGIQPQVETDIWLLDPPTGQPAHKVVVRYLLCSDGLNKELSDEEITEILNAAPPPATEKQLQKISRELMELALGDKKKGSDNITFVLVDVCEVDAR